MRLGHKFGERRYVVEISSLVTFLAAWELVARFLIKSEIRLPTLSSTILALFGEGYKLFSDIGISMLHLSIGLSLAILIGILIGSLMGWFKIGSRIGDPIVELLRPIPPLAWIPFAIIWIGLNHQSAGFIIFIGAFFPILTNTYTGFKNVPPILIESAKVLGCTKGTKLIRYVALPASLPFIVAGIRISVGVGWMCVVAAEMFVGGDYGLGTWLWRYYALHQMNRVMAYMIVLGLIGLAMDWCLRFLERRVSKGEV